MLIDVGSIKDPQADRQRRDEELGSGTGANPHVHLARVIIIVRVSPSSEVFRGATKLLALSAAR